MENPPHMEALSPVLRIRRKERQKEYEWPKAHTVPPTELTARDMSQTPSA